MSDQCWPGLRTGLLDWTDGLDYWADICELKPIICILKSGHMSEALCNVRCSNNS